MVDVNALTRDDLCEWLSYSPETGEFRWLKSNTNRFAVGGLAGSLSLGYVKIQLHGRRYFAHRLAWLYMTGAWPDRKIDHRDGCRSNNKWENLRTASDTENARNSRPKSDTASGYKGVTFLPKKLLYNARIQDGDNRLSLGCFKTSIEAHRAYAAKAIELFGEFARVA